MKRRIVTIWVLGIAFFTTVDISKNHISSDYAELSTFSSAHASAAKKIFGQVHYDQTNAIPSQASLLVQLIEHEKDGIQKVISETHITANPSGETTFQLPIQLNELKSTYKYSLKARISLGDSLIYVSETPTIVDHQQSGYIIRLASIGQNKPTLSQQKEIIGSKWTAREIDNIPVIENSDVNFTFDREEAPLLGISETATITKHYNVSGSDGCNRFFSSAAINQTSKNLNFNPLNTTFIACPRAISEQENLFLNTMTRVRSYEIDNDNVLHFKDKSNNVIARFVTNNHI